MPKHGFLTAKAIGNRIKSKGLQKLRWFCQPCAKQCRDENGFKCHCETEAHQRQLLLIGEDPDSFIDNFSNDFEETFLSQLKRTKGTKRIQANHFYQEYIAHKEHIHMNSTKWRTLTEFIQDMGKKGFVIVDETPKGWFIKYIDRDPEVLRRQAELDKRLKHDKDDEERQSKIIDEQIRLGKQRENVEIEVAPTELIRQKDSDPIKMEMDASQSKTVKVEINYKKSFKDMLKVGEASVASAFKPKTTKRKKSAMESIKEAEEERKRKKIEFEAAKKAEKESFRKDYWLAKGIVVKILNKKLSDGKYYKQKGIVMQVLEKYGAKVRLVDSKTTLTLDQNDLETVLPKVGGLVLLVNGSNRGLEADLVSIDKNAFSCTVKLAEGARKGEQVAGIPYEDVCKIY